MPRRVFRTVRRVHRTGVQDTDLGEAGHMYQVVEVPEHQVPSISNGHLFRPAPFHLIQILHHTAPALQSVGLPNMQTEDSL